MARLLLTTIWLVLLLVLPAVLLATLPLDRTTSLVASGALLIGLALLTARFAEPSRTFLLSICFALGIVHIVALLLSLGASTTAHLFLILLGVIAACGIIVQHWHLHLHLGKHHLQRWAFAKVGIRALLFGFLFYVLREPLAHVSDDPAVMVILLLALAVAYESVFRLVVFRTAENAFGYRHALWLQAVTYALAHLLFLTLLLTHYTKTPTALSETPVLTVIVFLLAKFWFGYRLGVIAGPHLHPHSGGNLPYAILLHWLTNLVTLGIIYSLV